MSPLQLVSSGLIPANDLSDGVGDTGGLELVLPKRMTLAGTTGTDGWSGVAVVVGEDVMVLVAVVEPCCDVPLFKTDALPPVSSW